MGKTLDKLVRNELVSYSVDQAKLIFGVGSAVATPYWALVALNALANGNIRGAVGLGAIATLHGVAGYYGLKYAHKTLTQR